MKVGSAFPATSVTAKSAAGFTVIVFAVSAAVKERSIVSVTLFVVAPIASATVAPLIATSSMKIPKSAKAETSTIEAGRIASSKVNVITELAAAFEVKPLMQAGRFQ